MRLSRTGLLLILAGAGACCLAGCASRSGAPAAEPAVSESAPAERAEYRLQVGDKLSIVFPTDRSLDYTAPVTPDGTITVPTGEEVTAAGRTIAQVKAALEESMSDYLLDPAVAVVLVEVAEQPVYVLGEVAKPGQYFTPGGVSVTMAIATAGGLLSSGKPGSVVVIRSAGESETRAFKVDVSDVLTGRNVGKDVTLMPYDIVYVPKSIIGKVGEFVDLFFEQIAPAQLFYLRGYDIAKRKPLQVYQ